MCANFPTIAPKHGCFLDILVAGAESERASAVVAVTCRLGLPSGVLAALRDPCVAGRVVVSRVPFFDRTHNLGRRCVGSFASCDQRGEKTGVVARYLGRDSSRD